MMMKVKGASVSSLMLSLTDHALIPSGSSITTPAFTRVNEASDDEDLAESNDLNLDPAVRAARMKRIRVGLRELAMVDDGAE